MKDPRGKPCPVCDSPLVDLRSISKRKCSGCKQEYDWPLNEGQRPLIGSNRSDRK